LREAIHSPTNGFTRVNYELGRRCCDSTVLRKQFPSPVALHGGIDGSNLYLTRTDVYELLAQAFDRLGVGIARWCITGP
jgi:hypothetical protein